MRNVRKVAPNTYKDLDSNRTMNQSDFVKKISNPNSVYHDDFHIRKINNVKVPVSNPDNKNSNNLVR